MTVEDDFYGSDAPVGGMLARKTTMPTNTPLMDRLLTIERQSLSIAREARQAREKLEAEQFERENNNAQTR